LLFRLLNQHRCSTLSKWVRYQRIFKAPVHLYYIIKLGWERSIWNKYGSSFILLCKGRDWGKYWAMCKVSDFNTLCPIFWLVVKIIKI
jgi:hypothetical protein